MTILYSAAELIDKLVRGIGLQDGRNYAALMAYIEFANIGEPVDPVPTILRDEGLSYYNGLAAPYDYLRVPVLTTGCDSTDTDLYPNGNRSIFHLQATATVGHKNGLTFSEGAGSYVYGGAILAAPVPGDSTKDLLLSRFVLTPSQQIPKVVGKEVTLIHRIPWV
jgi:hypothetical protein